MALEHLKDIPPEDLARIRREYVQARYEIVKVVPQTNGLFTLVIRPPDSATSDGQEDTTRRVPSSPEQTTVNVSVDDRALEALSRVSQSEVGHFAKYGQDQLAGGLAAVVDTIVNRAAHAGFPNTIEEVINQPKQFSAINALGTWEKLPDASADNATIVADHVAARSRGQSSIIGGATNFLNPFLSSASAMQRWGQHVVDNAVEKFGSVADKDVHYHGFAPNTKLPRNYNVQFSGNGHAFSGNGISIAAVRASAGELANNIVRICDEQWRFFEKGQKKERDDPQYKRIGEFWNLLNIPYDGRTLVLNQDTGERYNPPWSSAFISYVVNKSGGTGFKFSQAHCHYVQDLIAGRPNPDFEALSWEEYAPQPGDILHYGRRSAKKYDFAEARAAYLSDSFYPSHSDFVVSVKNDQGHLFAIGGNVQNSAGRKKIAIDSSGKLNKRKQGGVLYPWIAVLRCLK